MATGQYQGVSKYAISQLFLAVFLDLFGYGIVVPILPFFFEALGKQYGVFFAKYSTILYGLLIAVYSLMQFIMAPLWGVISDRIGRRKVILTGVGGSSIGFFIFGISTNLIVLFIARIVAGFFTAATLTVSYAYIADITPPEDRSSKYGILVAAFGLGFALGPAVGGYLTEVTIFGLSGFIVPSLFASLMSLCNFLGASVFIKESLPEELKVKPNGRRSILSIKELAKLKQYPGALTFALLFAIVTLGFSNWVASFALISPEIDPTINSVTLGYLFTYVGLIMFFSQPLLVTPLSKWIGESFLIKSGAVLSLIGFLILPFAKTLLAMFIANTPLILGISLLNPAVTSVLSKTVPANKQGEVMGVRSSLAALARVIGPLIAGGLLTFNIFYPYYIGSLTFVIIIIYIFFKITFPSQDKTYSETSSESDLSFSNVNQKQEVSYGFE